MLMEMCPHFSRKTSVCQSGSPATRHMSQGRGRSERIVCKGPFQQDAQLEIRSNLDCFSFAFDLFADNNNSYHL